MSREKVEIVRRFADHWNETGVPPWAEMDPEVVFVIDPDPFVAGTYRALVFRFSNGRIVLYRSYLRREEALEAVGLSE